MQRPASIDAGEFCAKLEQLKTVTQSNGFSAIYLGSEGAMRWLTGYRHQVVDIHPGATTTVQSVIRFTESGPSISFFSDPWEKARVLHIMEHGIWNTCGVPVMYGGSSYDPNEPDLAHPALPGYGEIERAAISPLAQGTEGNQWDKLQWLIATSRQVLVRTARKLRAGMNGWQVRRMLIDAYHEQHVELNLVMLGLSGMKDHLHPVIEDDSVVEEGAVVKLVVGARYYDMFHSASQLVKIGSEPSERERQVHQALVEATLAYADLFRNGATERELHASLQPIFAHVAHTRNLPGFEQSAYLHHPGGPLSPLGNRDFVIARDGARRLLPYAQFSVNPVDCLEFLKFELQGVVLPEGEPIIFDEFSWTDDPSLQENIEWHGCALSLPTIISNEGADR